MAIGVFKVDFVGRVRADFVFDFKSDFSLIFIWNRPKSAFGLTTPNEILISPRFSQFRLERRLKNASSLEWWSGGMQATHRPCTPSDNSPHHQTWPEDRARAMQLNPSKSRHSETNPVPQQHPNRYRTMRAHSACPGPSGNPNRQAECTPKVSQPRSGVKTGTRVTRVRIDGILVVL